MLRNIFVFILLLCSVSVSIAQDYKDIRFGIYADYTLINDKSIGDLPLKGNSIGITIGFARTSPKRMWAVDVSGGYGFLNTFNYPSIDNRIANRYTGDISGEYLHKISRSTNKLQMYLGGKINLQAQVNQILPFSNSEVNYFAHLGIAPKLHLSYPIGRYSVFGQAYFDVLAVVFRPAYSIPFRDNTIGSIRVATLDSYGSLGTKIGIIRRMRNSNALSLHYSWQYDHYNYQNTVKQAFHNLTFVMYLNL